MTEYEYESDPRTHSKPFTIKQKGYSTVSLATTNDRHFAELIVSALNALNQPGIFFYDESTAITEEQWKSFNKPGKIFPIII